jgi:hypothetical protein
MASTTTSAGETGARRPVGGDPAGADASANGPLQPRPVAAREGEDVGRFLTFTVVPLALVTLLVCLRQGYESIRAGNLYLMAFVAGTANLPRLVSVLRRGAVWAQLLFMAQLVLMVGELMLWWELSGGGRNPFQRADSWPWLASLFVAATAMIALVAMVDPSAGRRAR